MPYFGQLWSLAIKQTGLSQRGRRLKLRLASPIRTGHITNNMARPFKIHRRAEVSPLKLLVTYATFWDLHVHIGKRTPPYLTSFCLFLNHFDKTFIVNLPISLRKFANLKCCLACLFCERPCLSQKGQAPHRELGLYLKCRPSNRHARAITERLFLSEGDWACNKNAKSRTDTPGLSYRRHTSQRGLVFWQESRASHREIWPLT